MESSHQNVAVLNRLLRGELSAVETYRYTYDRASHPHFRAALDDCMQSHARRIQLLRRRIQALGGIPARTSGTWGVLAMTAALGADLFGPSAAVSALELGERRGHADYLRALPKLDPQCRAFVQAQLVPSQVLTHEWIQDLKRCAQPNANVRGWRV
jgi:hypothetical protein